MKIKADISSVCPEPQENPGLQVGKESGICSWSWYWSDDKLTSKARGGEGGDCGFSNAFLAAWELLLAAEVGRGGWQPSGGLSRDFRMEQMSQRKGSNSDGDKTHLKSPSPLCIRWNRCGSCVCVCVCVCVCACVCVSVCAHVHTCTCVCWKENRLYSQINLCAYPLSAKPGLWDLEYVLFFF